MTTKKKMKRRDYEADLVAGLIELMEAGTNPWQREWSAASNTPHTNLTTGAPYKGSNPALLELQMQIRGSSLPLWIPGGQGKAKGWRPKKGSKACCICMPMTITRSKTDDNGDPIITNGEVEMVRSTFFAYKGGIFNAADMEGDGLQDAIDKALSLNPTRKEPERLKEAEEILNQYELKPIHEGFKAYYSPTRDQIVLPERRNFLSSSGYYATLAHEMVHSTGHLSRLKREGIVNFDGFGTDNYAKEELVAELGAFLVCTRLSIASKPENHASYLKSWITRLKEQPSFLLTAFRQAKDAANLIAPEEYEEAIESKSQLVVQS
jgi:antirestriction protein ArdC